MIIRERRAKSIRRKRLGIIEQNDEDDDLSEILCETQEVFVDDKELNGNEMLETWKRRDEFNTGNPGNKLLVRMLSVNNPQPIIITNAQIRI